MDTRHLGESCTELKEKVEKREKSSEEVSEKKLLEKKEGDRKTTEEKME